ncbi:LCP family protein [Brevibacterium moorei]|uniref:LCP family protein n=1 Tax=Brevibacterium moorei TaxID=2968457 RepID=UPI00211CF512|nr:LCP family protein [Brevibacterium sp. 68QC2CO]
MSQAPQPLQNPGQYPSDPGGQLRERPRKKKMSKGKRNTLIILSILLVIILLIVGAVAWYGGALAKKYDEGTNKLTQEQIFGKGNDVADSNGTNVMLLGSDARGYENVEDYDKFTGVRSDTLMIAHFPATKGKGVQVVSIPRDTFWQIPGKSKAKINAAMSWGGIPLTIKTVQDYLKIKIDHVAVIDFEGFKDLTDALGGVDVQSQKAFSSHGQTYTKGTNHLNGEQALWFVRERHAFADGDMQRQRNQQAFLKAVVKKTVSKDTLTSPSKVSNLVGEFAPYLTVDEDLSASRIAKLGLGIGSMTASDITFATAPISGDGREAGGQLVLYPDMDRLKDLRKAFDDDTIAEYAEENGDEHYK